MLGPGKTGQSAPDGCYPHLQDLADWSGASLAGCVRRREDFGGGDSDEPDPPKEQMRESFLAANKRIYEENKLRRSAEAVAGTHAACLAWDAGRHPTGSAPLLPLQPPGLTPWPKLRRSGPPPPVPPEPPATPATPATPARVMATAGLALEKRRQVLHLAAAPAAGQVGPKATPAAATQPTAATAPMPPPSGALYRLFYKAAQTSNGAGPVNEPAPAPTAPASTLPPDHYAAEGVHSNTGQAAPEFEIAPVGMASSDSAGELLSPDTDGDSDISEEEEVEVSDDDDEEEVSGADLRLRGKLGVPQNLAGPPPSDDSSRRFFDTQGGERAEPGVKYSIVGKKPDTLRRPTARDLVELAKTLPERYPNIHGWKFGASVDKDKRRFDSEQYDKRWFDTSMSLVLACGLVANEEVVKLEQSVIELEFSVNHNNSGLPCQYSVTYQALIYAVPLRPTLTILEYWDTRACPASNPASRRGVRMLHGASR